MRWFQRVRLRLQSIAAVAADEGFHTAARLLWAKAFFRSRTCWYEHPAGNDGVSAPAGLRIVRVTPGAADAYRDDILKSGAGDDIHLFLRGAECYVAYWNEVPAGIGWRFQTSRLLSRLGRPDSDVYAGSFYVREEFRGRGIYPALLRAICSAVTRPETHVFAQVSPDNLSSRRGLEKAGFQCVGMLRVRGAAGCIVSCRLTRL